MRATHDLGFLPPEPLAFEVPAEEACVNRVGDDHPNGRAGEWLAPGVPIAEPVEVRRKRAVSESARAVQPADQADQVGPRVEVAVPDPRLGSVVRQQPARLDRLVDALGRAIPVSYSMTYLSGGRPLYLPFSNR